MEIPLGYNSAQYTPQYAKIQVIFYIFTKNKTTQMGGFIYAFLVSFGPVGVSVKIHPAASI